VAKVDDGGEANATICGVKYGIEAFKECIAVDKVKTLPRGSSNIPDN